MVAPKQDHNLQQWDNMILRQYPDKKIVGVRVTSKNLS
jgi:hypothetical protein